MRTGGESKFGNWEIGTGNWERETGEVVCFLLTGRSYAAKLRSSDPFVEKNIYNSKFPLPKSYQSQAPSSHNRREHECVFTTYLGAVYSTNC
jgi:hypothetical protein